MTKLVEVALPLEAISAACKRDKNKKTGTIKNVHKWFAPMPTPAWRALLFATLVDDPGDEGKRAELLRLVERLVPADGNPPDAATLGKVRLLSRGEIPARWSPESDRQVTVWEVTQRLVKRLSANGEQAAADLLRRCRPWADAARDLAQWLAATALVTRPAEALDHDALVTSWSELQRLADRSAPSQGELQSGPAGAS